MAVGVAVGAASTVGVTLALGAGRISERAAVALAVRDAGVVGVIWGVGSAEAVAVKDGARDTLVIWVTERLTAGVGEGRVVTDGTGEETALWHAVPKVRNVKKTNRWLVAL